MELVELFILFWMMFNHILDDFVLQGCLANLKQRSWWEKNYPDKKYRHDYLMALNMHAFSWTFMITLPLILTGYVTSYVAFLVAFCLNWFIHATVDDLKANELKINLTTDQLIHWLQIGITYIIFVGTGL